MKILLMSNTKIKYIPYANFYLNCIDCEKNDVHFLIWHRDEQADILPQKKVTLHEFICPQENEISKYKKVISYIKYRKFAKTLLKKEKFDFIIILPALPGTLLYKYLAKNFHKKFILDYRDISHEKIRFFRKIIANLVENSVATFVSSDKFRDVLPICSNIYTSHNFDPQALPFRNNRRQLPREHYPLRIAFWGFIRHKEVNISLLNRFGNDKRFELHYYGNEQATAAAMKEHIAEKDIKNVFFHGEFRPEERYEFIKNTDIIHNLYDVENDGIQAAMGNKYYDGIVFYLPQICNKGIYMGERAQKCGTGICIDLKNKNLADTVFSYYKNLDWEKFEAACDAEVENILKEYEKGEKIITDTLNKI
ncbi:MAG: hypothetical protein DBX47_00025 [Clostridiales bacterium]|nr:MAG: hypothetical protein DBX47_00025 [Clostridiales bacterium]